MKLFLSLLAISAVAIAIAADQTPKKGLPGVRGQYASPATFEIVGDKLDTGTLSTRVRTLKAGRKMKIQITGIVSPTDTPVPIDVTLSFTKGSTSKRNKVTSSSFLLGYHGPLNTDKARFKQKRKTLTFTLKSGPGGASILNTPIEGSVNYQCKFGRKTLSIVGNGTIHVPPAGTPIPYRVNLAGTLVK